MKLSKRYLATAVAGAVLCALVFWLVGGFTAGKSRLLLAFCDAFSVTGVLMICIGGLIYASKLGAFDMISYGIKYSARLIFVRKPKEKFENYYEYVQKRSKNDRKFGYIIVVGGGYLIIGIILAVLCLL